MSGRNWRVLSSLTYSLLFMAGCLHQPLYNHSRQEFIYEQGKLQKFTYVGDLYDGPGTRVDRTPVMEALTVLKQCDPAALPQLADLPVLEAATAGEAKKYTGLIQNLSGYDVTIPSANSQGTLVVPAYSWLEYTAWQPEIRLYGFVDGRQVYFQRLRVKPRQFQYLGNRYDFVATIRPEPSLPEAKPSTSTRRRRRPPHS